MYNIKNHGNYFISISSPDYRITLVRVAPNTYHVNYFHVLGGWLDDMFMRGNPKNIWRAVYHDIRAAEHSAIATKLR